jgi:transposase
VSFTPLSGPIRFLGVIPNTENDVAKLAKRLAKHGELDFCYEASGCGYGIHRQLTALGHRCMVVAPSMIPRKPGERIDAIPRSWRFFTDQAT